MSAYIVERQHICYLVDAALVMPDVPLNYHHRSVTVEVDHQNASNVAQMLWDENFRSVYARYGKTRKPESYGKHQVRYETINPVELLKAIRCYEYQSCECDDWENTEAFQFCKNLLDTAITKLPGYRQAPWGAPQPPKESNA